MQGLAAILPDFSKVIPEKLKPYAKFVIALVFGLIYLLVSQTVIDDATGEKIAAYVALAAGALGVLGTTNIQPVPGTPPAQEEWVDGEPPISGPAEPLPGEPPAKPAPVPKPAEAIPPPTDPPPPSDPPAA